MDDKLNIIKATIYICIGCYRKYKNKENYLLTRIVYFREQIFNFVDKSWNEKVNKTK